MTTRRERPRVRSSRSSASSLSGWTGEKLFDFGTPFVEPLGVGVPRIGPMVKETLAHIGPSPQQAAILELGIVLVQDAVLSHAANGL